VILSLIRQDKFSDYEIIVADAGSKDKTIEIAESFGCKIVPGGLPARGRNNGAKAAKGDILFFIDADVRFYPHDFIDKSISYFKDNKLTVASFHILPHKSNIYLNPLTMNLFYNMPQKALQGLFPMGAMGIIVSKEAYDKVSGFDESVSLAEDVHFVQQVAKSGKFGIVPGVKVYMPLRRFERDGYLATGLKYLACGMHMALIGPARHIKYDFDHYDDKK
jgi:glycosyltransferase involved in cell wall biosynthesis